MEQSSQSGDRPKAGETPTTGPVVFVVDDDPVSLARLATVLRTLPAQVHRATSAIEALRQIEAVGPPQLIVTDLYMPGIDGWRFCRLLRSSEYPVTNHTPVLAVSATYSGVDPELVAMEIGADAFLNLPADNQVILSTARRLLDGDRASHDRHVLVVDDDFTTSAMLAHAFRRSGYVVHLAETGEVARSLFAAHRFHVVVLDYYLPDVTGDLLLKEFFQKHPETVYVIETADANPHLSVQLLEAGASSYVRKPFRAEYVVDLCARAIRERSLLRVESVLERRTRQVEKLLHEKELLLQELHHRVKNNMYSVAAYLELKAESASEEAAKVLRESKTHVHNAMRVYELLNRSGEFDRINIRRHLDPLVRDTVASLRGTPTIHVSTTIEPVEIDPSLAITIGIIVNELVTNSVKHGFVGRERGQIVVEGSYESEVLSVAVRDDGVGLPSERPSDGFGIALVRGLAGQINATVSTGTPLGSEGGTGWVLDVPVKHMSPVS